VAVLSNILEANDELLNDLAGRSKNTVPPDVAETIRQSPEVSTLLRMIKIYGLDETEITELGKMISSMNAKALIIAAGMGSRLKGYTEDTPKCMLDFGGKTLLERQLESYHECGINNISLIRGYKSEKINYDGICYYENPDFEQIHPKFFIYGEEDLMEMSLSLF